MPQTLQLYDYAMFGYFGAYVLYAVLAFFRKSRPLGYAATGLLAVTWLVHTAFLVERATFYYKQYQGFLLPSTNMFEAIGYFAWLVTLLYLIAERLLKTRAFGVIALIFPVACVAYAARAMAPDPRELMPSLKSYWLVFHVTAMFISYSGFFLAFVFAFMYLLRARGWKGVERLDPRFTLKYLDDTAHRIVTLSFPVLTLGVFLGAVWADSAWGRYWGWDPKETWALITWLIYLFYLHLRHQWGVTGYKISLINVLGFAAVLITFQGVNLLDRVFKLNSIHAYAEGESIFMITALAVAILIPLVMLVLPAPKGVNAGGGTAGEDTFLPSNAAGGGGASSAGPPQSHE
jgi:cytochrome c-type biogenesis protein CcsB